MGVPSSADVLTTVYRGMVRNRFNALSNFAPLQNIAQRTGIGAGLERKKSNCGNI